MSSSHPRSSRRSGLLAGPLAFLAPALAVATLGGCAGREPAPPPRAVRFAAFVAPALGAAPTDTAALSPEDVLLEVVTALSGEPELDFVLVAGPVVGGDDRGDREALVGALGSIAAPVFVALTADEAASQDLLEALERGLPRHKGAAAYAGRPVAGWQPAALGADGKLPAPNDGAGDDGLAVPVAAAFAGAGPPAAPVTLVVVQGPEPRLGPLPGRPDLTALQLPPLGAPPHLFAVVTISPEGQVSVVLRTALGDPAPPAPPPVQLQDP
ncbi:MAG: hypothetical protein KF878_28575 [Planctomycetes bacterium]|nr:hypothetical protein [Planctomycetota bacterium]